MGIIHTVFEDFRRDFRVTILLIYYLWHRRSSEVPLDTNHSVHETVYFIGFRSVFHFLVHYWSMIRSLFRSFKCLSLKFQLICIIYMLKLARNQARMFACLGFIKLRLPTLLNLGWLSVNLMQYYVIKALKTHTTILISINFMIVL